MVNNEVEATLKMTFIELSNAKVSYEKLYLQDNYIECDTFMDELIIDETKTDMNSKSMVLQECEETSKLNECSGFFKLETNTLITKTQFWHPHVYLKKDKLTPFYIHDILGGPCKSKHPNPINLSSVVRASKVVKEFKSDKTFTNIVPNSNEPLNLTIKKGKKKLIRKGK